MRSSSERESRLSPVCWLSHKLIMSQVLISRLFGGLSKATLAWFDPQRKMFKKIPIDSQVEVVSMIGDVALYKGKPVVHMHMVVATSDGSARGGHVLAAFVSPTLEVMVTVDPIAMQKRLDPEHGLTLIDPALR